MTVWAGTAYRYFAVDAAEDISGDTLTLGLDGLTYPVTGDPVDSPPEEITARLAAATPAPGPGLTRYWWRALTGDGTDLPLIVGSNTVHGLLTDLPEKTLHTWRFRATT